MTTPQDRTAKAREARRINVLRRKAPEYEAALRELGYTVIEPTADVPPATVGSLVYRDRDGDTWRVDPADPRRAFPVHRHYGESAHAASRPLRSIRAKWGPLTPIEGDEALS